MKVLLVLLALMVMMVTGEPPKPVYGPPKTSGGGSADDQLSEPANYEFSYEVQDDKEGLNFGHMENRVGDSAKGSYHVLLPDGRTQRVDYVADQAGYMPKLTYEGDIRPGSFGPPAGSVRSGSTGAIVGAGLSDGGPIRGNVGTGGEGYRY